MTRRRQGERGAVLVEFTLVAMLLVTILFATIEFGLSWQDRMTVQTATRAGVRVGSNLTTSAQADYNMLASVRSALQDIGVTHVDNVVIYKSTSATGAVPTNCVSPVVASQTNSCNAYTGAQLAAIASTQFGCGSGKLDNAWCPTNRQNIQSVGPDYLGIWVRVTTPRLTGLFGKTMQITDTAVMRLEPAT